jgi:hypothetical protein
MTILLKQVNWCVIFDVFSFVHPLPSAFQDGKRKRLMGSVAAKRGKAEKQASSISASTIVRAAGAIIGASKAATEQL